MKSPKVKRILAVELEPTHYKTDLWNAVCDSKFIEFFMIYTKRKNWAPDGGHNYLKFPNQNYQSSMFEGRGIIGALKTFKYILIKIINFNPDIIFVCGYSNIEVIFTIIISCLYKKRFLIFVDEFNVNKPPGKFSLIKWIVRESIRKVVFKYADGILVCGRKGLESALKAGCNNDKVYNFPYVVDLSRIQGDIPDKIPEQCFVDLNSSKPIIFFSGRMIPRKGLPILLSALSSDDLNDWILWIEGSGPELQHYITLAKEYGIDDRCRFLGFCQYDLHSWLMRSSEIIIIPSLQDNWGIVVDEGLQLGKTVISSNATGSGHDRIIDKSNGYIFPAGDSNALTNILNSLINNNDNVELMRQKAKNGKNNITPADNLNTLLNII